MQYITDLSYVINAYTWAIQNAHIYQWKCYFQSKNDWNQLPYNFRGKSTKQE